MPIQLLPPMLANQIAAGEVVERPASVVKELVENSIDAGATHIDIDIEKGGHKRIRIRDNGCGIEQDQLTLALSRHATSKIANFDDLNHILSLGFRGEALASISSVSRLTLVSKPAAQEHAWQAYCEGRDMAVKVEPAAHPDGTTIEVLDLFYNTPARRKFLRTEKTEFQHIEEVAKRIALSHPEVSIILRHNDTVVRRYVTKGNGGYAQRVAAVLGQKFISRARCVEVQHDNLQIQAWLGDETTMRSTSDVQFSFVNGRGMRDKLIHHAVRQAYELQWGVLEQPAFVIYLTLPPDEVDVNVHPAKHEVRFHQSRLVHDFIVNVVSQGLSDESDTDAIGAPALHHDYIRPLSTSNGISEREHPLQSAQSSAATSLESSWQGNRSGTLSGSRISPNSSARHNSPVSRAYHNAFAALHEVAGHQLPDLEKSQTEALVTPAIILTETQRVYVLETHLALVDVAGLMHAYVYDLITQSSAAQPLMMPIAVEIPQVSEQVVELLSSHHFVIDKVMKKWRLQQVPSQTRHLPWLALFPILLASDDASLDVPLSLESLCAMLFQQLNMQPTHQIQQTHSQAWHGQEKALTQHVWAWFSNSGQQQELIQQHAILCPRAKLMELFTHA